MLITPLVTALLAVLYVVLSIMVIRLRYIHKVSLGDADVEPLRQMVRSHANFAEYVPLSLLMLWFLESIVYAHGLVVVLGALLILGRVSHVIGMTRPGLFRFRQAGMLLTFTVIITAAVRLIWYYLPLL